MNKIKKIVSTVLCIGLMYSFTLQAQIYKYTDKQGNIHYSDTKPFEDAKAEKLKSITVVQSSKVSSKTSWKRSRHKEKFKEEKFNDLIITAPKKDQSIWGTGGNITVSVNIAKLKPKYRVKFFLDGLPHGKVKSNSQLIADVIRGEHKIYAQVIDARTRKVIKTSPEVTFYVKQKSKK